MHERALLEALQDLQAPTDETVCFALDGVNYEIDLSSANAAQLRGILHPWVAAARRAHTMPSARLTGTSAARPHTHPIRAWAAAHNYCINDRGLIPWPIQLAYRQAHTQQTSRR